MKKIVLFCCVALLTTSCSNTMSGAPIETESEIAEVENSEPLTMASLRQKLEHAQDLSNLPDIGGLSESVIFAATKNGINEVVPNSSVEIVSYDESSDTHEISFTIETNDFSAVFSCSYLGEKWIVTKIENSNSNVALMEIKETRPTEPEEIKYAYFSEIKTGEYAGKDAVIRCVFSDMETNSITGDTSFTAWIKDKDGSFYPKINNSASLSTETINKIKMGRLISLTIPVYSDNSLGIDTYKNINISDEVIDIEKIKNDYRDACSNLDTEDLLRSPEIYKYKNVKYSGSILQIIEQSDQKSTKFLLDVGYGETIQVVYNRKNGEERFLEGDAVSVYGQFYVLDDYINIFGVQKTVPRIGGIIIDRN